MVLSGFFLDGSEMLHGDYRACVMGILTFFYGGEEMESGDMGLYNVCNICTNGWRMG